MTIKGRSPTVRHVSRTHRVALDWLLRKLTPKTNSQTCKPTEILHVTNGIIFCVRLTWAITVLQIALKWGRKEREKIQVKKRVTAKSKPMMNLVSRCSERTPDVLASTASESPEKRSYDSQTPLSAKAKIYDRTKKPVVCSGGAHRPIVYAHSSSYSEWNVDQSLIFSRVESWWLGGW